MRHYSHDAVVERRRSGSPDSPGAAGEASSGSGGTATRPPGMRRNLTSSQLPRNASHAKLKKNLSHGQLGRLAGSNRNLVALVAAAAATNTANPPTVQVRSAGTSPGQASRGKSKRSRSDGAVVEKDLHQQEVELAEQMRADPPQVSERKKIGFAVGSAGDVSDEDDSPEMEGSGMQEDEWEDQSGSASPETTRQNTANNSRRPSASTDRPPDHRTLLDTRNRAGLGAYTLPVGRQRLSQIQPDKDEQESQDQDDEDEDDDDDEDESDENLATPLANPIARESQDVPGEEKAQEVTAPSPEPAQPSASRSISRTSSREHSNPATKHLLDHSTSSTAPALVSNVSTLDDMHSSKASSAASTVSSNANVADGSIDQHPDELVSHFIPSASHPSSGSAGTTTVTPATTSDAAFSAPEMDKMESMLNAHRRGKSHSSHFRGPASPGSTISGSSGAATPALSMSRTELRLKNEKFMADMEEAAAHNPPFPAHKYDRRNESLKSYLHLAAAQQGSGGGVPSGNLYTAAGLTLGPEIFQGRFKAVNTELKVVQQFHNPLAGSIARLQKCKDSAVSRRMSSQQQQRGKAPGGSKAIAATGGRAAPTAAQTTASTKSHTHAQPIRNSPSTADTAARPVANGPTATATASGATAAAGAAATSDRRSVGRVTFSQDVTGPPADDTREVDHDEDDSTPRSRSPNSIARRMWDNFGAK